MIGVALDDCVDRCAASNPRCHILSIRLRRLRDAERMVPPSGEQMMTGRMRVFESQIALVERIEYRESRRLSAEDYSPEFQIAFPYRGVFVWHVEHDAVVGDPNQVLFVRGGETYRIAHHPPDGFAEVIITPAESCLRQVAENLGFDLETHPLFDTRSRRATPDLQCRCAAFVQQAADASRDEFHADEELLALMRDALAMEPP